jgi:hypothetical protein
MKFLIAVFLFLMPVIGISQEETPEEKEEREFAELIKEMEESGEMDSLVKAYSESDEMKGIMAEMDAYEKNGPSSTDHLTGRDGDAYAFRRADGTYMITILYGKVSDFGLNLWEMAITNYTSSILPTQEALLKTSFLGVRFEGETETDLGVTSVGFTQDINESDLSELFIPIGHVDFLFELTHGYGTSGDATDFEESVDSIMMSVNEDQLTNPEKFVEVIIWEIIE